MYLFFLRVITEGALSVVRLPQRLTLHDNNRPATGKTLGPRRVESLETDSCPGTSTTKRFSRVSRCELPAQPTNRAVR